MPGAVKCRVGLYQPFVPDGNTTPMLGLLYLAAMLSRDGFEVRIFDARIDRDAVRELLAFRPDVLGVSAVTAAFDAGLRVARSVKESSPRVHVVFGGPHASALPEQVAAHPDVDFVLVGESENAFPELCRRLRDGARGPSDFDGVSNLVFAGDSETRSNARAPFLTGPELDTLPLPAYERMDLPAYFSATQTHGLFRRGRRVLPLMSSRGCPQSCTFCCRVLGKKIRARSVDSVLDELRWLVDVHGVDEVYFEDDNFTTQRRRALEVLERLARFRPRLHVKFANGIRADRVDPELLAAMKAAGVYSLSFGIESGCPGTLQRMKKGLDLERARENVLLARSMGFLVGANCILGYPGETPEDVETSLRYFFALPLDSMAIVNLVPFPGTDARRVAEENGYLTEAAGDFRNYFFSISNPIPLIETPQLSGPQLVKAIRSAYRRMYLRPKWMAMAARNVSLRQLVSGAGVLLGFPLSRTARD